MVALLVEGALLLEVSMNLMFRGRALAMSMCVLVLAPPI